MVFSSTTTLVTFSIVGIGGLTVSTALTLLLIPTLYVMIEERFPRRMEAAEPSPALQGETA